MVAAAEAVAATTTDLLTDPTLSDTAWTAFHQAKSTER